MRRDHSPRTLVIMFNHSQVNIGKASTPQSLYYCLFAPRIYGVVVCAYSICGEPRIQRNTNQEVAIVLISHYVYNWDSNDSSTVALTKFWFAKIKVSLSMCGPH